MRTIVACLVISGTMLSAAPVVADEGAVTTDEMQSMCKSYSAVQKMGPVPRTAEEVVLLKSDTACMFYVAALANLIMLPGVAKSLKFCLPDKMEMDQLRVTIEGLMRNAPREVLDYSAALSTIAALRMNFPCAH